MGKPRRPRRSAAAERSAQEARKGWVKIAGVGAAVSAVGLTYGVIASRTPSLDETTLCPATPTSITVLLIDVTDPLTTAQRQDFQNQLTRLRNSVPRYGKLIVSKVDSASDRLLEPVIVRCNPGTADDESTWTGNPKGTQKKHEEQFVRPLESAFGSLTRATGSERSPIFESIQSVALTELLSPETSKIPRRLVVVSDLLQNTDSLSFYSAVPQIEELLGAPAFRRVRTDLKDVEVELWMLERSDAPQTQPRALVELWDRAIAEQGGTVSRAYNVSG
jgi:hypothetical protein